MEKSKSYLLGENVGKQAFELKKVRDNSYNVFAGHISSKTNNLNDCKEFINEIYQHSVKFESKIIPLDFDLSKIEEETYNRSEFKIAFFSESTKTVNN